MMIFVVERKGEPMALIDVQDAISIVDSIDTWQAGWRGNAIESLKALPSAQPKRCEDCENFSKTRLLIPQPERKTGKWIRWYETKEDETGTEYIPHCKCSECGTEYDPHSSKFVSFCNVCGVKMEEGDHS